MNKIVGVILIDDAKVFHENCSEVQLLNWILFTEIIFKKN